MVVGWTVRNKDISTIKLNIWAQKGMIYNTREDNEQNHGK